MKVKFLFIYIFLLIFKKAILDIDSYDFHKKGTFSINSRNYAIFDPTEFKTNEEIYFELTANSFKKEQLGYKFLNTLDDDFDTNIKSNLNYVNPQKKSQEKTGSSSTARKIRNYVIKKREGNYLILYFEYTGRIEIKNTITNKAKKKKNNLPGIVAPIVISVLAIGFFYYIYYRKKKNNKNNNNEAVVYNENTPNIANNQPYATYLPNSNMNNQSYNNNCLNMKKKKKKKNNNNNMNQQMNNNINDNMKNNNDINYCSNMANNNDNFINNNMMNNNNNSINNNLMNNNVIDQTNNLNQPYTSIPQSSNDHRTGYSSVQAS